MLGSSVLSQAFIFCDQDISETSAARHDQFHVRMTSPSVSSDGSALTFVGAGATDPPSHTVAEVMFAVMVYCVTPSALVADLWLP